MDTAIAIDCKISAPNYEGYTPDWQAGQYDFEPGSRHLLRDKHLRGLSREDLITYGLARDAQVDQLQKRLATLTRI